MPRQAPGSASAPTHGTAQDCSGPSASARACRCSNIGSGAGDVALLLADLVGPRGRVLGIDANPEILACARARAAAVGLRKVDFERAGSKPSTSLRGSCGGWPASSDVPARPVSFFGPCSGAAARRIVAFIKIALGFPAMPVHTEIERWMVPPENAPGPDVRIGTKLFRLFIEAGLPLRRCYSKRRSVAARTGRATPTSLRHCVAYCPRSRRNPGFDAKRIDVDTIAERLQAQVTAADGIQLLPALVGAWTRTR